MEATDAGQLQHQGGTGLAAGLWHAVDGILRARAGGAKGYSANSRSSGSRDLARALGAWLPAAVLRTTWSETTTQDLQVPENSWTTDELSASRTSLGDDSKYLVLLFFSPSTRSYYQLSLTRFLYSTRLLLYGRNGDYYSTRV